MYRIERTSTEPAKLAAYAKLLREAFPQAKQFDADFLRWEYADNPCGAVVGYDAFAGEALAAHYVTIPIRAQLEDETVKALLSLNTATSPQHQGKGLFTQLAQQTYAAAASEGYSFVIGVANANSSPGFTRKLGFQLITPLTAKIGFGKPKFRKSGTAFRCERLWTNQDLEWRVKNPHAQYFNSSGMLMAKTGKPGISAILHEKISGELVLPKKSGGPSKLWLGCNERVDWKGSSFFDVPERLKPSPLHLIFLDLSGKGRKLAKEEILFRALDFDAY